MATKRKINTTPGGGSSTSSTSSAFSASSSSAVMSTSSPPLSPSFSSSGGPGSPRSKKTKTTLSFDEELEMDAAAHMLDDGDVVLEEKLWGRKPLEKPVEPSTDYIRFQQIDIDYTIGDPLEGMKNQLEGAVPIVRMYGTTEDGHSVMANVYGVIPYFWTPAPPGFRELDCELYRSTLNRRMKAAVPSSMIGQKDCKDFIIAVEVVHRASIMGYQGGRKIPFLKISLSSPKLVPKCRDIIETGMDIPGYGDRASLTYESNLPFVLRFMIDYDILGGNWIELQPNHYRLTQKRVGTAQIEVDVNHDEMKSLAPEGEWSKSAPLRVLSFDIECAGRKGMFPEPDHDPVIQIANVVTVMGESKPFIRNVFTLKSCTPIVGAHVLSYDKEADLLAEWQRFIQKIDPDIITGYNITNFDLYYLINRARKLNVSNFAYLGRIMDKKAKVKETTFSSKAYGRRDTREVPMHGRVQFDMLQVIQREHKLTSYSLNAVSAHFLGQQKEDVQHSIITDLFNGTAEDRRRLAVYCLKDAYLPLRLLEKLMVVINYTEMARVTGVPMGYLLSRGQQIKVVSQLYRQAKKEGLLIPYNRSRQTEETYEGAFVIPPKPGFYDKPIATLDFTSLYPSIMMAHNLCYSTLLRKSDAQAMSADSYETSPGGDCFIKPHVKKGVLPRILEDLIAARTKAKNDLKNEKDPLKRAVLDGRQLALKVSANSVYGFTGASVGQLPCFEISASVTAYGRQMIETTKRLVEEKYTMANGYPANVDVLYGDTDSVMVSFGVDDVAEAMKLGREAANYVTSHFLRPINLDFEKVYYPFLLMKKKRYAGLLWMKPDNYDKMDAKGIESVRRDNCALVRNVVLTSLKKILIERNIPGAIDYVKKVVSDLLQNKVDLSQLVISKALSRASDAYKAKQAHVELAERMKKRDQGSAPGIGDRVQYVIIQAAKGAKGYQKSEDPLYVLENNIPLDTEYYLEKQLSKPLKRIFQPIMDSPASLFAGEHTRTKYQPVATNSVMAAFVQRRATCMGCRAALEAGETILCKYCKHREADIYREKLYLVSNLERQFSAVWTQCQTCQGSLHQPVLCTSRDCPIFYMRKKVQKDLQDAQEQLAKFSLAW